MRVFRFAPTPEPHGATRHEGRYGVTALLSIVIIACWGNWIPPGTVTTGSRPARPHVLRGQRQPRPYGPGFGGGRSPCFAGLARILAAVCRRHRVDRGEPLRLSRFAGNRVVARRRVLDPAQHRHGVRLGRRALRRTQPAERRTVGSTRARCGAHWFGSHGRRTLSGCIGSGQAPGLEAGGRCQYAPQHQIPTRHALCDRRWAAMGKLLRAGPVGRRPAGGR